MLRHHSGSTHRTTAHIGDLAHVDGAGHGGVTMTKEERDLIDALTRQSAREATVWRNECIEVPAAFASSLQLAWVGWAT